MKYQVDENGYYGSFGGAFIPEMLYPNVEELREHYLSIVREESFQTEFQNLLHDFVGRPTPLYLGKRLSERYGAKLVQGSTELRLLRFVR
jgi:tryptophan synthase beta chain